jgi:hypothetical protein
MKEIREASIFVSDSRNAGNIPLSAIGALAGIKEPMMRQAAENHVTITFYQWRCVKNCEGARP